MRLVDTTADRTMEITTERRSKPRVDVEFPAVVRGVDAQGRRFEEQTTVCNLSAGGLYLRLREQVELDSRLFIYFRFTGIWESQKMPALAVAAHGVVRRIEEQPGGSAGVGVLFQHYRLL